MSGQLIPEDIMRAALSATDSPFPSDIDRVARALMAEREACAVRAEALDRSGREWLADSVWPRIKADTAADIRRGSR